MREAGNAGKKANSVFGEYQKNLLKLASARKPIQVTRVVVAKVEVEEPIVVSSSEHISSVPSEPEVIV